MPDRPTHTKRTHPMHLPHRSHDGATARHRGREVRYAELCCRSNFSFLRGASHPEELAERAAELGYAALAITDRNTLAGVVRMHCAAKSCGLPLIVGAEIIPVDAPSVFLYATDRAAYGRLCRIITQGRLRAVKGDCKVTLDDVAEWNEGLIAVIQEQTLCAREGWRGQVSLNRTDGGNHTNKQIGSCHSRSLDPSIPRSLDPSIPSSLDPSIPRPLDPLIPSLPSNSLHAYRDIFGDRLYMAAGAYAGSDDDHRLAEVDAIARATGVPMIATNDVHYHAPDRRFLQDVLTCIREHCTLETAGRRLFANAERHLKPIEEIKRLFDDYPRAVARTVELAERCGFSLDELQYEYPEALCPPDRTAREYLAELAWAGARDRYRGGVPEKVRRLIEHELELIGQLAYEPYFLTVWDIVQFARMRNIFCQGRGSAANSAVCYCLGITSVDPDRTELLFERFVSAERNEPPDIDVDFEHERREEVFQYIYNKYGREHAGIVAEVITYRRRSAIRDVGKALGLSLDHVDTLAKKHEWWDKDVLPNDFLKETGLDPCDRTLRMLRKLVGQIAGFPRHLSQHVGGFVITRGPLCEMVPIENAAMPDRTFIEWDKDDIDALGILKIDCLSLGMLTAIHKCFNMLEKPLSLHTVPPEDPAVYDMICHADTVGVFQIESRAQMSMLPRLKPRCFYDLVIEVAIVRPGPIQGGMVHPYLRRRSGKESFTYPNDAIKEVLHRTLGVPLFQEQAMRLAVVAAGFTPGEADQLRRAMGAWRRHGEITRFRTKLIEGMKAGGLTEEFAERCFKQICGFGEYGFPESHAASFALLVYVSAWLKRYHPAAFCAALINSQPMGFYKPAQLVRDAKEHGVIVRPIDVNCSGYDCRLEDKGTRDRGVEGSRDQGIDGTNQSRDREGAGGKTRGQGNKGTRERGIKDGGTRGERRTNQSRDREGAGGKTRSRGIEDEGARDRGIEGTRDQGNQGSRDRENERDPASWGVGGPVVRLGMRLVRGISRVHVEDIARARNERPFISVADLACRSSVSRATLARLAAADAMRSMGLTRRKALWQVLNLSDEPPMLAGREPVEPEAKLPDQTIEQVVVADYETTGLCLSAHPIELIRDELGSMKIQPSRVLRNARQGQWMKVAGLVLVRQRPSTALGIVFCTLEDETGVANLVIKPNVYQKYRSAAHGATALVAQGRVERQGEVVHLNVSRLTDLSKSLTDLRSVSRDFH